MESKTMKVRITLDKDDVINAICDFVREQQNIDIGGEIVPLISLDNDEVELMSLAENIYIDL
jgi:hypothetical protein